MVKNKEYSFSFTGASALITETLVIAKEYVDLKDWKEVETSLLKNNLMSKIKLTTFKREYSEIKKRLSLLTDDQRSLLINGSLDDAKAMILLSLVKTYAFFKDFIVEVIRNKYLLFDRTLTEIDYIKFINNKSINHGELLDITETTSNKVRQVVFKLLEQVGLISEAKNGIILKPMLNSQTITVIVEDNPEFLVAFLYSNEEIKSLIRETNHA